MPYLEIICEWDYLKEKISQVFIWIEMVGKGQGEMFQEESFDLIVVNFLASSQKKIFFELAAFFWQVWDIKKIISTG